MMSRKHGRHTPAFLLLFLADGPSYGALLLSRMQTELPHCFSDSAIVYRSLQEMEKNGLVEINWENPDNGAPRKWYTITSAGRSALAEFAEDIRQRRANFEYFLSHYTSTGPDNET
jgi:PadR family transcriptional regulator, regulatory protein PadR